MIFFASCVNTSQNKEAPAQESFDPAELVELKLHVQGMTCEGCENAVIRMVGKLEGVASTEASHKDELVTVKYLPGKLDPDEISETITRTGYKVVGPAEKSW